MKSDCLQHLKRQRETQILVDILLLFPNAHIPLFEKLSVSKCNIFCHIINKISNYIEQKCLPKFLIQRQRPQMSFVLPTVQKHVHTFRILTTI